MNTRVVTPVPGAIAITVPGNYGRIPGATLGSDGTILPLIREADGTTHSYAGYPGAALTFLLELNQSGAGVGYASLDFKSFFSYSRTPSGSYTRLDYPGALALGTFVLGVNQAGTMVGYTSNPTEDQFAGFLRLSDGTWQPFNIPGAISTVPFAVNDNGTVAGGFQDAIGWHGFISMNGVVQKIDYPGAGGTNVTGINNFGVLVGNTFNSTSEVATGPFTGFTATPTPEPASVGLAGCVLVFAAGWAKRRRATV